MENNKPFYFYHLIPKNADLSKGILTPQYFYNHSMFKEFDACTDKYRDRLCNVWGYYPNKKPEELTREEIIKGLNKFRKSKNGCKTVYLFRYPPYEALGNNMRKILQGKDILRIDIDNKELKKYITDIFWGYWFSNSDNKKLDREYYENISKSQYFQYYDDYNKMSFAKLNHISLTCKYGYIPNKFIEKM